MVVTEQENCFRLIPRIFIIMGNKPSKKRSKPTDERGQSYEPTDEGGQYDELPDARVYNVDSTIDKGDEAAYEAMEFKKFSNIPNTEDIYEDPRELLYDRLYVTTTEETLSEGIEESFVAICDFNSTTPKDLSFKKGERFKVRSTNETSWCHVVDEASNLTGNVPWSYMANSRSLFIHDWYHGKISAAEARARLTCPGNTIGSYLVRENGSGYTLAILTKVKEQNKLMTINKQIVENVDGTYKLHSEELNFTSIAEIIVHCKEDRPDQGQHLRKACCRVPPDLVDLCSDHQQLVLLPSADFKKEKKLSKGNFANVFQGIFREQTVVALKVLKKDRWTDHVRGAIAVMRKLRHPNIVRVYGVYAVESLVLVTELMKYGDLRNYLRGEEGASISYQDVLIFAKQIACGMAYLEEKRVIHRDLAAKNVLLGAGKTVKVADCGLMRTVDYHYVEAGGIFPYRWSAPEIIKIERYSTKSDVWAFGIVLVELATHGELPYKDMTEAEVTRATCAGTMHKQPEKCPHDLYIIMKQCWAKECRQRPMFKDIMTDLDALIINNEQSDMLPTATSGNGHRHETVEYLVSGGEIVFALFNYMARGEDELSFYKGDNLELIEETRDAVARPTASVYMNVGWDAWRLARHLGSGQRGFIPSNYVARAADRIREDWYHPDITRTEADQMLKDTTNGPGTFLIRKADSEAYFVLCIKAESGTVKNYRIMLERNGRMHIHTGLPFGDLQELIQYYSDNPGLCCQLSSACRVQRPAIQELSPGNVHQDDFEIKRTSLKNETKLASGHFGEVWKGLAYGNIPVAIKISKPKVMSQGDFMTEATIMKKLHHPNLVRLYGVCSDDPIWIVTEFAENGSLLENLREDPGPKYRISQTAMIFIAQQVAAGMAYLAERAYIHRDLAARNVLVFNSHQVKIADFGLARAIPEAVYTATSAKCPIRWTAPEGLAKKRFSVQSDIWAFGILLVEIFTRGEVPYKDVTQEKVSNFVQNGGRPAQPKPECPDEIYRYMLECWEQNPGDRPSFNTLLEILHKYLKNDKGIDYVDARV